jgi:hypothetical protein
MPDKDQNLDAETAIEQWPGQQACCMRWLHRSQALKIAKSSFLGGGTCAARDVEGHHLR